MGKKEAKALLDTSAEKNRNLLTAFVLFMVTTSALVLSITDMDLLSGNKSIPLPLLAVDLPIYIFYVFLPALLLALHFNLLQNVQEHRAKLEEWLKSLPPNIPANTGQHLFPFIYDVAIVRNRIHSTLGNRLVAFAVWLLYVYLPFLTLSLFLVWFADLQEMITLYHLVLLVLDGWLLWLFRYRPTASADKKTAKSPTEWFRRLWQTVLLIPTQPSRLLQAARLMTSWVWQLLRWLWRHLFRILLSVVLVAYLSIVLSFWTVIQRVPAEWVVPYWNENKRAGNTLSEQWWFFWRVMQIFPTEPTASLLSLVQAANWQALEDVQNMSYEWLLPRINVPRYYHPYTVSEDAVRISFWAEEAEQRKECEYADKPQTEQPENAKDGSKNQTERRKQCQDSIKIDKLAAWNNSPRPLDLRGRRLLFASLPANQLRRADLSKADLRGADLGGARLQDADLTGTKLQGADLSRAQLQGAYLQWAELQGAYLQWAGLQGAYLQGAGLQGANLRYAQLQGADLWNAQLQGASLEGAQLQGADLQGAGLQGAYLQWARLQGAILWKAQLQGAHLIWAWLQGADLFQAQLQGAKLFGAQLQGANLSQTRVRGVKWREAQLGGTYVKEIDTEKTFDFGAVTGLDKKAKQRLQNAKQRQENPPALPRHFGTTDATEFAKHWLPMLCSPKLAIDMESERQPAEVQRSTSAMTIGMIRNWHRQLQNYWTRLTERVPPYTAITPAAIVEKLETSDCLPYADEAYKEYPILATTKAKAAKAPDQPAPTP